MYCQVLSHGGPGFKGKSKLNNVIVNNVILNIISIIKSVWIFEYQIDFIQFKFWNIPIFK